LNNQPEKTRDHLPSVPRTSTCANAPVYCSLSTGEVFSQARRRMITSPIRVAWPGFN
jgi:hypothetical protein